MRKILLYSVVLGLGLSACNFTYKAPPLTQQGNQQKTPGLYEQIAKPATSAEVEIVVIPQVMKMETRQVIKTPARIIEHVIPGVTRTQTRRVLQRPERVVNGVRIPPTYRTVQETVVVQEASTQSITIPPVYETVTETVVAQDKQWSLQSTSGQIVQQFKSQNNLRRFIVANPNLTIIPTRGGPRPNRTPKPFSWDIPGISNPPPFFVPPAASAKFVIPHRLFKKKNASGAQAQMTLIEVFDSLEKVLTNAKPSYEFSTFAYKNGFVVLTRGERIDGKAKIITDADGAKIKFDEHPVNSIGDYLDLLFKKPKTRYRYIAFFVTLQGSTVETTASASNEAEIKKVFSSGGTDLPRDILKNYKFTDKYKCEVHIYEFAKIDPDQPTQISENMVPAPDPLSTSLHKTGSPALTPFFGSEN